MKLDAVFSTRKPISNLAADGKRAVAVRAWGEETIKTADGNVKKLEIAYIHNCCKGCSKHIEEALGEVKGVTTKTVEPKKSSFVIEGDFAPADVVKELLDSGFYPTLK